MSPIGPAFLTSCMVESPTMSRISLTVTFSGGRANATPSGSADLSKIPALTNSSMRFSRLDTPKRAASSVCSPRRFVRKMAPRNLDQRRKGQPLLKSIASPAGQRFVHESGRVLMKIGDLGTDQENQPSGIQPDEKNNHDGKARIDGGILSGVGHKSRECHPDELPQYPCRSTAD